MKSLQAQKYAKDNTKDVFMVNMSQALIFTAKSHIEKGLAENEGFVVVPHDAAGVFKDAYESGILSDWVKARN
ncbi:hypothetical protein AXI76_gp098 [Pseudoalteromonas phage H101]|uniref:Uncharacterized protein n=1 Tax=Pseudoalteromonas phage H101 TaxID=1654919 RepID=A0A0H4IN66_9CAUD|nr:hypothetical protein AXI76_gp098 [Pseudoalteromonas phage H101]AKO60999.1 hypothetical protein [Pseudoalteromonas phage H101]